MKQVTITRESIVKLLKLHEQWLEDPDSGRKFDWFEVDLRGFDLNEVNLRSASLTGAQLQKKPSS